MSQSIGRTRDGRPIGAWLFKANPDVWDLHTDFEQAGAIPSWSVHPSYRSRMLGPGQRCFLWASEDRQRGLKRGIYGVGEVTGQAKPGMAGPSALWRDEARRRAMRAFVPVIIHRLREPILAEDLHSDPRFADAEVFRSRQMSNPVVLRPEEVAVLDEHDLTFIPQTEEQRAYMESGAGGGDWDADFGLVVEGGGYSIYLESEADPALPYAVVREWDDAARDTEHVARHATLSDAVRALASVASSAGRTAPISDVQDDDPEWHPLAVFRTSTGPLSIARTGDQQYYALIMKDDHEDEYENDDENVFGPWSDLGSAIVELGTQLDASGNDDDPSEPGLIDNSDSG